MSITTLNGDTMVENYDYLDAMKADIRKYLIGHAITEEEKEILSNLTLMDIDDVEDELWTEDFVTGNGSGSYTYDSKQAKEYVLDNMDLVSDLVNDGYYGYEEIGKMIVNGDWESIDVSIRCMLLRTAIEDVIKEGF